MSEFSGQAGDNDEILIKNEIVNDSKPTIEVVGPEVDEQQVSKE